jgi:hypothetical protein
MGVTVSGPLLFLNAAELLQVLCLQLMVDLAEGVDHGTLVGAVEDTVVDKGHMAPSAAAAAAGRMMLATLPADTLPLNTHPGTQRSSARLRARLPRDTARGAGLFTLCRRRIALGVGQGLSVRQECLVPTVLQILTARHLQQHAQPALRIRGLVLVLVLVLLVWDIMIWAAV